MNILVSCDISHITNDNMIHCLIYFLYDLLSIQYSQPTKHQPTIWTLEKGGNPMELFSG